MGAERQRLLTGRCAADGRPPAWCTSRDAAVHVLLLLQVLHQGWCISKPGRERGEVGGMQTQAKEQRPNFN